MHEQLYIKSSRSTTVVEYHDPYSIEVDCEFLLSEYPLIVADSNIPFSERVHSALLDREVIWLKGGEDIKSLNGVVSLLKYIEERDLLAITKALVIGGGTVQDASSTAFALLRRGIRWDFIPSTVLAQCDSCIGSKTSINSTSAKNTFGLFWPPNLVYIDESLVYTQGRMDLLSGFGDALHYLFTDIAGLAEEILSLLEKIDNVQLLNISEFGFTELTRKCHLIKKTFVEVDEFDKGIRRNLNLGHTFGHGIEVLSSLKIPHGVAVMHGILISYLVSRSLGYCKEHIVFSRLTKSMLRISRFNWRCIKALILDHLDDFIAVLLKDKKSIGSSITFVAFGKDYALVQKTVSAADMRVILNTIFS